jgi:hypothetical protein
VLVAASVASTFPMPAKAPFSRSRSASTGSCSPRPTPTRRSTRRRATSRYLGAEADLFLNWQVSSDVA